MLFLCFYHFHWRKNNKGYLTFKVNSKSKQAPKGDCDKHHELQDQKLKTKNAYTSEWLSEWQASS